MRIVLLCSVGILISALLVDVINAVPVGLRQMDAAEPGAGRSPGIVNFVGSVVVLLLSTELTDYALVQGRRRGGRDLPGADRAALDLAAALPAAGRSCGRAREIVCFGLKSQLVTVAELVNVQTDKVIIAAMLGPTHRRRLRDRQPGRPGACSPSAR